VIENVPEGVPKLTYIIPDARQAIDLFEGFRKLWREYKDVVIHWSPQEGQISDGRNPHVAFTVAQKDEESLGRLRCGIPSRDLPKAADASSVTGSSQLSETPSIPPSLADSSVAPSISTLGSSVTFDSFLTNDTENSISSIQSSKSGWSKLTDASNSSSLASFVRRKAKSVRSSFHRQSLSERERSDEE
jgi:hypothetical protein